MNWDEFDTESIPLFHTSMRIGSFKAVLLPDGISVQLSVLHNEQAGKFQCSLANDATGDVHGTTISQKKLLAPMQIGSIS